MDLRSRLIEHNKQHNTKLTPRELREVYQHVVDEAVEYFLDTVDDSYLEGTIDDLRMKRL